MFSVNTLPLCEEKLDNTVTSDDEDDEYYYFNSRQQKH